MALAVTWLAIVFGRGAIPPLLPAIIEELRITPAEAGIALTHMWGLYALPQFPGGRRGPRTGGVGLLVLLGAA